MAESPSTQTRTLRWVGIGLLLAGFSLLGYFGWQYYGTNWVAAKEQRSIVQGLESDWAKPTGSKPSKEEKSREEPKREGQAYAVVRIPAFGDSYAVPLLEGIELDTLAKGFGHFTESASVGEKGNFALAGHRVTHNEPLRGMPELDPGDEIIIETQDATYYYVLDTPGDGLEVPFTSGWVVGNDPRNPDGGVEPKKGEDRLITLTTCSELFHTDNRLVAFGHLDRVVEK